MTKNPGHIDTNSGSNRPRNGSGPLGPKSGSILTQEFLECRLCKSQDEKVNIELSGTCESKAMNNSSGYKFIKVSIVKGLQ